MRNIIESELVFYKDYNLFIYLKIIIIKALFKTFKKIIIKEVKKFSKFFKNSNSNNDLSNVKEIERQDF